MCERETKENVEKKVEKKIDTDSITKSKEKLNFIIQRECKSTAVQCKCWEKFI